MTETKHDKHVDFVDTAYESDTGSDDGRKALEVWPGLGPVSLVR